MAEWTTKEVRFWVSVGGGRSPAARDALLCLFDEWLTGVKAQAWDRGWYSVSITDAISVVRDEQP